MLINLCTVVLIMIHGVESLLTLKQTKKVWVKQKSKSVSFECEVTDLSSGGYVHWYHKKDDGTFKRILYISESGTATTEVKHIAADKKGNSYGMKLSIKEDDDAGMYYCASWDGSEKVFGPGTRLYVTGDKFESPKVSGYLPYRNEDANQTMLCNARDMFPDLVKFTWEKKNEKVDWTNVEDKYVVEQSYKADEKDKKVKVKAVSSMMIIDKNTAKSNEFRCTVTHEGNTEKPQIILMKKVSTLKKKPTDNEKPTCPPTDETIINKKSGDSEQIRSLYMFVYAYGVMIMKNGMYFCVVFIFLLKRKAARKKDESS